MKQFEWNFIRLCGRIPIYYCSLFFQFGWQVSERVEANGVCVCDVSESRRP